MMYVVGPKNLRRFSVPSQPAQITHLSPSFPSVEIPFWNQFLSYVTWIHLTRFVEDLNRMQRADLATWSVGGKDTINFDHIIDQPETKNSNSR